MIFVVQCSTNASNAEDNTLWQVLPFLQRATMLALQALY